MRWRHWNQAANPSQGMTPDHQVSTCYHPCGEGFMCRGVKEEMFLLCLLFQHSIIVHKSLWIVPDFWIQKTHLHAANLYVTEPSGTAPGVEETSPGHLAVPSQQTARWNSTTSTTQSQRLLPGVSGHQEQAPSPPYTGTQTQQTDMVVPRHTPNHAARCCALKKTPSPAGKEADPQQHDGRPHWDPPAASHPAQHMFSSPSKTHQTPPLPLPPPHSHMASAPRAHQSHPEAADTISLLNNWNHEIFLLEEKAPKRTEITLFNKTRVKATNTCERWRPTLT